MIFRLAIVLGQAFEIRKTTHRDTKLRSNRADCPVRQNPFFLDITCRRNENSDRLGEKTARFDSIPHRRHYLQELGRALEPSRRVLLKQHLKGNGQRLWDAPSCSSGNAAC